MITRRSLCCESKVDHRSVSLESSNRPERQNKAVRQKAIAHATLASISSVQHVMRMAAKGERWRGGENLQNHQRSTSPRRRSISYSMFEGE
jgi:hypothetical protein